MKQPQENIDEQYIGILGPGLPKWHSPSTELPVSNVPVLIAFIKGHKYLFYVAKWTGKRWLEFVPDEYNSQFSVPDYWQEIKAPIQYVGR